jgi:hypothetical protein
MPSYEPAIRTEAEILRLAGDIGAMCALALVADRQLTMAEMPPPPVALERMESRQVFSKIVVGF